MFIVIEIQTTDTTAVIATAYADENIANQAYHTALAAAAVSSVRIHTVDLLNAYGDVIKSESYTH